MDIKGTAVISIRDYVKQNHLEQYPAWMKSLPYDSQSIFGEAIDSSRWYPVKEAAINPTLKIGELFFNNNSKKGAWEAGRYSAQKALTGIYKIFVKASSPGYIVQRASRIFATYYRPCSMAVLAKTKNSVTLRIISDEKPNEVIENRIAGWIEKALEISGAGTINISFTPGTEGDQHIIDLLVSWT